MPSPSRREHLITTALKLFGESGYHRTGIDTIVKCAGVSKKTLYNHFRSKEELIVAVLRHYDGVFRNGFMRQVESAADSPREQLLSVFDVTESWFSEDSFYGCMFINAIGEYSDRTSAIREVCKEFKRLMRSYIRDLCQQSGAADPDTLADEIALLLEGAIVTAQVSQKPEAARTAKKAAANLIEHALCFS